MEPPYRQGVLLHEINFSRTIMIEILIYSLTLPVNINTFHCCNVQGRIIIAMNEFREAQDQQLALVPCVQW
jgi:hypothetical protein